MAEQLILSMWHTICISHLLSPKQHSTIRFVRIPHIETKRKPLTKVGSPNIIVHMVVAMYDTLQAVLGFLCRLVLHLSDVHAHVDAFAAFNGMVQGYSENLVIRRTLVIKRAIFYGFYGMPVTGVYTILLKCS